MKIRSLYLGAACMCLIGLVACNDKNGGSTTLADAVSSAGSKFSQLFYTQNNTQPGSVSDGDAGAVNPSAQPNSVN